VLSLFVATTALVNAHIVYEVKRHAKAERAELWVAEGKAHLKLPEREIFWDLVHERRLDVSGGRSRDEPIAFEHIVRADELFPRGWKLPRHGHRRVLGHTCDILTHHQEVPRSDGSVKARFTWCVWSGLPLALEYGEKLCRGHRCTNTRAVWRAREVHLGAAKTGDVIRSS
jgi:hypothetical protein